MSSKELKPEIKSLDTKFSPETNKALQAIDTNIRNARRAAYDRPDPIRDELVEALEVLDDHIASYLVETSKILLLDDITDMAKATKALVKFIALATDESPRKAARTALHKAKVK